MADREYTKHQKQIIQRYYDNRDQSDRQRLAELVTNIYLDSPKKQAKHWETAEEIMTRLKIPESRIKHVMTARDAALLAAVVEDLQAGRIGE